MQSSDNRFEYFDKDGEPLPAGATLADVGRFQYRCRTDPKSHCSINVKNAGYVIPGKSWKLTGDVNAPTLSPSINCADCWHGFIEAGVFKNTSKKPEAMQ